LPVIYIKRNTVSITSETLGECILFLAKSWKVLILPTYGTFDETNPSDGPSKKEVLIRHRVKYPKNIRNSSKTNVLLVFAGSAAGELLLPYVFYNSGCM
jgi:hypothetical protein